MKYLGIFFLPILCFWACDEKSIVQISESKIDSLLTISWSIKGDNLDSAFKLAKMAYLKANEISYKKGLGRSWSQIGVFYKNSGKYDSSLIFLHKCLNVRYDIDDVKGIASALNNMGNTHRRIGRYDSAIYYINKSISIKEKLGNKKSLANSYNNLALLHKRINEFDKALYYYSKSDSLYRLNLKTSSDSINFLNSQNNLASVLISLEKYDSALNIASWQLSNIKNNWKKKCNFLTIKGSCFFHLDSLDSALKYYSEAINLEIENNSPESNLIVDYLNLGKVYEKLWERDKEESYLTIAQEFNFKVLSITDSLKMLPYKELALQNIASLETSLGNYERALDYTQQYQEVSDSLFNETKSKQIAELQTQYETEKKEKEILIQQAEIEQRTSERNNALISVAVVFIFGSILAGFYFQRQKNYKLKLERNEVVHSQEVSNLLKDQETKTVDALLQGQEVERKRVAEDLHDRMGSLLAATKMHYEAALSTLPNQDNEQVKRVGLLLDKAVEGTRHIAHNMLSGVLTKFGLEAALKDLQQTVENNKLKVTLNTSSGMERLDGEKELQLYRIVQELMSNALKHAKATQIDINFEQHNGSYQLSVRDNGKGFDPQIASKGMGMNNIRNRAKKLNSELTVHSEPGKGSLIKIIIPA